MVDIGASDVRLEPRHRLFQRFLKSFFDLRILRVRTSCESMDGTFKGKVSVEEGA